MPVTPFHFGPAALVKAVMPRYFSFVTFGVTQAIIDTEPLYYMAQGLWPIHRFFHTYLGATVVAVIVVVVGKPISEGIIRVWNWRLSPTQRGCLEIEPSISIAAAAAGALFGAYSHVLLDSIMHSDMRPFTPFSNENALLYLLSIDQLHLLCTGVGIAGGLTIIVLLVCKKCFRRRAVTVWNRGLQELHP